MPELWASSLPSRPGVCSRQEQVSQDMHRLSGQGLPVSCESVGVGLWHSLQEQADRKGDASCGGSTHVRQMLR